MKFSKEPNDGSNSADFLTIKPGESVVGVFQGDPLEFYGRWENKKTTVVNAGEPGARFRFKVNFVTKDGETYVAKVWEQGAKVYNQLKSLNEDYPLDQHVVKITRQGEGTNTNYTILPVPGGSEIKPETKKMLSLVELCDLAEHLKANHVQGSSSASGPFPDYESESQVGPAWADEEIPF